MAITERGPPNPTVEPGWATLSSLFPTVRVFAWRAAARVGVDDSGWGCLSPACLAVGGRRARRARPPHLSNPEDTIPSNSCGYPTRGSE